jgi:hypothetical protein
MTSAGAVAAARMLAVQQKFLAVIVMLAAVCACPAQQSSSKPQVKVHMLNVCTPSPEEQQEISTALARIPKHPSFTPDFEVDRGRSVLDPNANPLVAAGGSPAAHSTQDSAQQASAEFVRIRHEFGDVVPFSNVQYSFSRDQEQMVETLVFRLRDPKDLLEIAIESSASAVTSASAMLAAGTPAGRIKLERFGKSSVVLARCSGANGGPAPDQSVYAPLFSSASSILTDYRGLLATRTLIPEELARMSSAPTHHKTASAHH